MLHAKTTGLYAILLTVSALICSANALANKANQKAPPELVNLVSEFGKAIKKKDIKAASAMSRFPLRNAVHMDQPKKSQSEFASSVKEGLPGYCHRVNELKLDENGKDWYLDCDGNIFFFGQVAGKWKYLGYENINE